MVIKSCIVQGKQQFYTTAVYTRVKGVKVLVSPGYVADSVDELAYLTCSNQALAVRRSALIRKMRVV